MSQPDLPFRHREAIRVSYDSRTGKVLIRCPVCDWEGDLDDFDCWGADEDCIFCTGCNTELQL